MNNYYRGSDDDVSSDAASHVAVRPIVIVAEINTNKVNYMHCNGGAASSPVQIDNNSLVIDEQQINEDVNLQENNER